MQLETEHSIISNFMLDKFTNQDLPMPFIVNAVKLLFDKEDIDFILEYPEKAEIGLRNKISLCLVDPSAVARFQAAFKLLEIIDFGVEYHNDVKNYSLTFVFKFILVPRVKTVLH